MESPEEDPEELEHYDESYEEEDEDGILSESSTGLAELAEHDNISTHHVNEDYHKFVEETYYEYAGEEGDSDRFAGIVHNVIHDEHDDEELFLKRLQSSMSVMDARPYGSAPPKPLHFNVAEEIPNLELEPSPVLVEEIRVSQMVFQNEGKAREMAEYIIDELDADVDNYFQKHRPVQKIPLIRKGSACSIESVPAEVIEHLRFYVDEPSTMDLFYEKGITKYKFKPLQKLAKGEGVDVACQERLHRTGEKTKTWISVTDQETQTKQMTWIDGDEAERRFRHLYPEKDDHVPEKISSRKASMEVSIGVAQGEARNIDRAVVGPKVKWSKRLRLLPPLPQNYHKIESFWTGSTYGGKYVNRQFEGTGHFNYPLMSTYESEFSEGKMESKHHLGIVTYPRGDTFEGHWRRGRHLAGRIKFCDDLTFNPHHWPYCEPPDRRFYVERDVGVKQAGKTLFSDRLPPSIIPPGMYDAGDGVYDPVKRVVTAYDGGLILRRVGKPEHNWTLRHCRLSKVVQERYTSSFNIDRLPCAYFTGTYAEAHPSNSRSKAAAAEVC